MKATLFDEAYADTVYRWQGNKTSVPTDIWDTCQMSANEFATAIGRFENIEHIHTDLIKTKKFRWQREPIYSTPIQMCPVKIGYVYQIQYPDGKEYIGSTTKTVEARDKQRRLTNEYPISDYGSAYELYSLGAVHYVVEDDLRKVESKLIVLSKLKDDEKNLNRKTESGEKHLRSAQLNKMKKVTVVKQTKLLKPTIIIENVSANHYKMKIPAYLKGCKRLTSKQSGFARLELERIGAEYLESVFKITDYDVQCNFTVAKPVVKLTRISPIKWRMSIKGFMKGFQSKSCKKDPKKAYEKLIEMARVHLEKDWNITEFNVEGDFY